MQSRQGVYDWSDTQPMADATSRERANEDKPCTGQCQPACTCPESTGRLTQVDRPSQPQ